MRAGEKFVLSDLTCIAYHFVKHATLHQLNPLKSGGLLQERAPVSSELLARIRQGASLSRDIVPDVLGILFKQGVLD